GTKERCANRARSAGTPNMNWIAARQPPVGGVNGPRNIRARRSTMMPGRLIFTALMLAGLTLDGTEAQSPPQRIVSINLCADELLLALADPGQIADLSIYATD